MIPRLFAIAATITLFYSAAMVMAFVLTLRRRTARAAARQKIGKTIPEVASAVVNYAAGSNDASRIRLFARTHPGVLEDCLLQYHATMSGEGRNRLAEVALDVGMVHKWCEDAAARSPRKRRAALARLTMVAAYEPARRLFDDVLHKALQDSDELARLEAARTLIHSGEDEDVAEIFHAAVSQSLIVRIVLADELRRHILTLCQTAIPAVLRSNDAGKIVATLDMLAAWERAVPLPEVTRLTSHPDKRVRLRSLRVLPLTPLGAESAAAIHRALAGEDEEICLAAAGAAGRLRMESALVSLARCLRLGKVDLARAAAAALAALPPRGWETLAELSEAADPITASAAVEALGRARQAAGGI